MNIIKQKELSLIKECSDFHLELVKREENYVTYHLEIQYVTIIDLYENYNVITVPLLILTDPSKKEKVLSLLNEYNKTNIHTLYLFNEVIVLRVNSVTDITKESLVYLNFDIMIGNISDWCKRIEDVI